MNFVQWIESQLVDDWKKCYKWASIWFSGSTILASIVGIIMLPGNADMAYQLLPLFKGVINPTLFAMLTLGLGIATVLGRVKAQGKKY